MAKHPHHTMGLRHEYEGHELKGIAHPVHEFKHHSGGHPMVVPEGDGVKEAGKFGEKHHKHHFGKGMSHHPLGHLGDGMGHHGCGGMHGDGLSGDHGDGFSHSQHGDGLSEYGDGVATHFKAREHFGHPGKAHTPEAIEHESSYKSGDDED